MVLEKFKVKIKLEDTVLNVLRYLEFSFSVPTAGRMDSVRISVNKMHQLWLMNYKILSQYCNVMN